MVTYVDGSAKSTFDYIMVRQGDRVKVCNVRVIPNEECVPKHKLLVMDVGFSTTKSDIRSSSQEYVYGNSRRNRLVKNIKAWLETR